MGDLDSNLAEARDLVVISDLHLSAGYDEAVGGYDRNEDFFYDGAFARLLEHLSARPRPPRLLLLGDVFDFLQVELSEPARIGREPRSFDALTVTKLEAIARGHPVFFEALGRFALEHPVDVVVGNHDIELIRGAVQKRLGELLAAAGGGQPRLRFHPWIYYEPGLVYAEHGHQYDETSSFATPLHPYLPDSSEQIDFPLSSFFVEYLFNRVEAIDPFADNVRPVTSYLLWALQAHPIKVLSTLRAHISLFLSVLSQSRELSVAERTARRNAYHRDVLPAYAADSGIGYQTLVAIDRLASVPAMTSRRRELTALILKPIADAAPLLGALTAVYLAVMRTRPSLRSFALFLLGAAGLAWREREAFRPATQRSSHLRRMAGEIDRLLADEGHSVPFYVFGHSHELEQAALRRDARYFNSGTWTPVVSSGFDLLARRETFSFVEIARGTPPVGRLMVWNDDAGRAEQIRLLAQ